jgi:hypothetical protein
MISNSSIRRLPHFLKFEFFDSSLVGGDCGTLDSDLALLDGMSSIESDFVVSLISVFHSQVEVLDVKIKEGVNELVLDLLPEDSGHLISIEFGNGVFNFDLLGGKRVGEGRLAQRVDAP